MMTVDFCGPNFLGRDLHSDVHHYPCSIPSLARSLDSVHLNGFVPRSPPLKLDVATPRDVAEHDSRSADVGEAEDGRPSGADIDVMSPSSSNSSRNEESDEPLLSPNGERFVMYPVR